MERILHFNGNGEKIRENGEPIDYVRGLCDVSTIKPMCVGVVYD